MEEKLNKIQQEYSEKINSSNSLRELDGIFLSFFGKNGKITKATKELPSLPKEELLRVGPLLNRVKAEVDKAIENRRQEVREESYKKLDDEKLDLEIATPAEPDRNDGKRNGHLHPITEFENQIEEMFSKIGFQQYEAPHVDTDYNNFEVLNIPPEHPARDLWDTLYIDAEDKGFKPGTLLLRTHTSNSQIHVMEDLKLPIRAMNVGRCFRYENLDARHEHTFDQFEIVYIDHGLSMANLQYLSEYFLKNMYGDDIKVRLKPGYYPFTEPSAHIEGQCIFCKGKGCKVCGGVGWLELAGAGMMHPQVLKNGGIDPKVYTGIAWGVGPGRMAMLKYGVEDVRLFNSGDLKFLEGLKR